VFLLPLDSTHQISILKDILSNHQMDCCGTVAECEQLERIIKSLMVNTTIDQEFKNTLSGIYSYGQVGKNASDLKNHINHYQDDLSQWIDNIKQYT
jgi:hypothetical protein